MVARTPLITTIAFSPSKIPVCAVSEAVGSAADLQYYGGQPADSRDSQVDSRKLTSIRDPYDYPDYGSGYGHTMLSMEHDLKSKDPYDRYTMPSSMGGALSSLGSLAGYPPSSLYSSPYSPYTHNPSTTVIKMENLL